MREFGEIEGLRRGRGPQPQRVDAFGAVSHDRPVIGDTNQAGGPIRRELQLRAAQGKLRMQRNGIPPPGALDLPGIVGTKPVVRALNLRAVADHLLKNPVLVPQSVADGWVLQGRERVDEAGGKPTKTAIAKSSIRLLLDDRIEIPSLSLQRTLNEGLRGQIHHV